MPRPATILFLLLFAAAAWLGMEALHELGHCLAAWATGGRIHRVVLMPLAFSRTDLSHNPHPLAVAAAGLALGAVIPCAPLAFPAVRRGRAGPYLRGFAGFCLVANGAYAAAGAFVPNGDAADLLRLGVPRVALAVPGAIALAAGFLCWHGQGPYFGLGPAPRIDRLVSAVTAGLLAALILGMLLVSG